LIALILTSALAGLSAAQNPGTQGGPLSEGQILGVLRTVNDAEVAAGQIASANTKNAGVRLFAQHMINDHTKANEDVISAAGAVGEQPADSGPSAHLKEAADSQNQALKGKSGADYDRAYMSYQVQDHQDVLNEINGTLMPSAKTDPIKNLLNRTQSMVQEHLDMARKTLSSLGA
jgi:putative membrane protein